MANWKYHERLDHAEEDSKAGIMAAMAQRSRPAIDNSEIMQRIDGLERTVKVSLTQSAFSGRQLSLRRICSHKLTDARTDRWAATSAIQISSMTKSLLGTAGCRPEVPCKITVPVLVSEQRQSISVPALDRRM